MGWMRTLLLGDIGNRLDIEDTERDISRLRGQLRRKRGRDQRQDARLDELEQEVVDLKVCLASVTRALIDSGSLTRAQVEDMVDRIEPPGPDEA